MFCATMACAQQTSVLFLGNSYTAVNDLPGLVQQLALSMGDTLIVQMVAPGGFTLEGHGTNAASLNAISSQAWDFVVLQEQSQLGALPTWATGSDADAAFLAGLIEANDTCTMPVFYMTWGRQNGDAMNCTDFPFMCTYEGMQLGLRDNYVGFAQDNGGWAAPVGMAWREVRDAHPLIELYQADESHPSEHGSYLAAAVMYGTLFKKGCAGASFVGTLQPDTAAILRSIAASITLDSAATWNLDATAGMDAWPTDSSSTGAFDITWLHGGPGAHLWTCSDGQTSTDADPTFTFTGPGIHTFTHAYTDPCGNTGLAAWSHEVLVTGTDEHGSDAPYQVWLDARGDLRVNGADGSGHLRVFDAWGRSMYDGPLFPTTDLPEGPARGLMFWSITDAGSRFTGKVVR